MMDADQQQQQEDQPEIKTLKARLKDKQFWIWFSEKHKERSCANNLNTHGLCCFNHMIGLPSKDGEEKPLIEMKNYYTERYLNPHFSIAISYHYHGPILL